MKRKLLFFSLPLFILLLVSQTSMAQLNGSLLISGKIVNDNKEGLPGISITIKGARQGAVSDSTGDFTLVTNKKLPFTLEFTGIGFAPKEIIVNSAAEPLQVQLFTQSYFADEVVVSASRKNEKLLQSPVTIEKLDIRALKESPAPSFYDALTNIKGIQMTTASLTFKVPNARGFNVPNNFRFMQLVDGVDVQAATLGVPLGNAIGPTELDIESVEITPGASSALYGMNAINGMSQLLTKSPYTYQGLSFYQRTGVNHINENGADPKLMTETALRYAKAFSNGFAFKVNASYFNGADWIADNKNDFNPQSVANPAFPTLSGANNPAYDGVNAYGNESNITITDKNGKVYNVRRTGYTERSLTDYQAGNLKIDGGLYYKFHSGIMASYTYRYGSMDGVFMRGNRIRLQGASVQNHKIELTHNDFTLRAYVSIENSGDNSFALKPLADNLETSFKTNSVWAKDYTNALNTAISSGADLASAQNMARKLADNGRYTPGTSAFDVQVEKLKNINDWDKGAAMWTSSKFYQADGIWNLRRYINWVNLLIGADYRLYDLKPDGNNFVDFSKPIDKRNTPGGNNIYYGKIGGFVQASKELAEKKLKLTASLRLDKNTQFSAKLNPRISAVYTLNNIHNFRISWQNGFRFPSLFEAYSFVNNGGVRRVGGLPIVESGLGYYSNSLLTNSVTAFNTGVNTMASQQNISRQQAAVQNADILKQANPQALRPEQISSFEAGYKASLFHNKVFVDAEVYYNIYKYFIGQLEVSVPGKGNVSNVNDTALLNSLLSSATYSKYRVQVNSQSPVESYGFATGITYNFYKTYTLSANANYNRLSKTNPADPLIPGFNTPDWTTNISFGNRAISKRLGFNLVWHWQNAFYWQNLFGNGDVAAYNTLDAQLSISIPSLRSVVKLGGTDVLNHQYLQYIGGPQLGALYYASVLIDINKK